MFPKYDMMAIMFCRCTELNPVKLMKPAAFVILPKLGVERLTT